MDLMFHAYDWKGQQACWSFRGFHAFRSRLVALSGVIIEEMQGFGGSRSWKGVNLGGIGELIRHADDSGILTSAVCGRIAPNLKALLERLDPRDPDPGVEYDITMGRILVQMMEFCATTEVALEFIGAPMTYSPPAHHHQESYAPAE